jgi:RNA polymerase sigma-70 factor, ECF subfamily
MKEDRQQEKLIIKKLIKRDEKELLYFYRSHKDEIFRFIFHQTNKKDIAEEITQDVFIDFIECLRDFRGDSSLKTFLFSIARNKLIDYIRKKKIKKILFSALPTRFVEKITSVAFDDGIEKKEMAQKIKKVFELLPNDYEIILRLKYIDGVKVKSIAKKLSIGFKATESLLFRARKSFIRIFRTT